MTDYLTPSEAAAKARCTREFIYAALLTGELKGFQRKKPKGRWLIDPVEVDKWIRDES
ncbi:helix-turn-helix domain-containing protein [Rhodococcus fascians]|nr:helix-turn-helix domain-containing protein [Rhodococcus fascians]MBY3999569.1 helix-turn-helix domain-containing protein [Rhodococcus fascians]MBY4001219.1 helix-turn-helix domain-containing protein [Rhodococcus fascians]MBY4009530.1 helix-turn-helix domain-containing protein [Rhodococcus fascians]MBY4015359.1 helix-turn-helix domain-containing protein [Rhodococcus fascians]